MTKSLRIKQLIFSLVKEKIQNQSLVLTPNLIRFLALNLIAEDQTLVIKIKNLTVLSCNRARLLNLLTGNFVISFVEIIFAIFLEAILMIVIYFKETQNCWYNYHTYFKHFIQ